MAAVTIRNLADETHRALKAQADRNGRSTEAEIRNILDGAVQRPGRLKIGSALAECGRLHGHPDTEVVRDRTPPTAPSFARLSSTRTSFRSR